MENMSERLRNARIAAGFRSASAAARHNSWVRSTYAAHENGQNDFGVEEAQIYAKAFKTDANWLLFGSIGGVIAPRMRTNYDNMIASLDDETSRLVIEKMNGIFEGLRIAGKLR